MVTETFAEKLADAQEKWQLQNQLQKICRSNKITVFRKANGGTHDSRANLPKSPMPTMPVPNLAPLLSLHKSNNRNMKGLLGMDPSQWPTDKGSN